MAKGEKKAHAVPQMTIAGLSRYMTTIRPASRRAILREEKYYDSDAQPPYYREVNAALRRHLRDGTRERDGLLQASLRIKADKAKSDYELKRLANNVAALKNLHACQTDFIRQDATYSDPPAIKNYSLPGAKVIISPSASLVAPNKSAPCRGCVKLYLGKTNPLDDEQAAYMGTALANYLESAHPGDTCSKRQMSIVDVFRSKTYFPPSATVRRTENIECACADIASMWSSI